MPLAPAHELPHGSVRDAWVRQVFVDPQAMYGVPRVTAELAREGMAADRKTAVASIARQAWKASSCAGSPR
ncbi:hypothetical protein [Pseudoclavibacter caeni]|uniref:IS3 family transposase n=1 Tax=Pseudoclavibacter caeni TaxID=908846 RepID=A0A7C8FU30_9MICO|nr:hypothetical protein [Pseudoclavibacter caeni]KAB1632510.1 hypothetical protein F8O02_05835 [Pseudoclavibacter caeni]